MERDRVLVFAVVLVSICFFGCAPRPASGPAASGATPGPADPPSAPSRPSTPSERAPAPDAKATPPTETAPALGDCQAQRERYGTWQPSAADVIATALALPKEACLPALARKDLVTSCIDAAHSATFSFGVETDREHSCTGGFAAAEWKGRHFIVVRDVFRVGGTFDALAWVYEVEAAGPKLFADDPVNDALCDRQMQAHAKVPEWNQLPADLRSFFCTKP